MTRVDSHQITASHATSAGSPLKVVVVANELPHPVNTGARIRILSLLKRLSHDHHVTLLAHRTPDWDEATAVLKALGIECVGVARKPIAKSGWRLYAGLLANLVSRRPYSAVVQAGDAMTRMVVELADQGDVDLWQLESVYLGDCLRSHGEAPLLLMAHNREATIWKRFADVEPRFLKRLFLRIQEAKVHRFEQRCFSEADGVVAVTETEAEAIRAGQQGRCVHVVDNGVDRSFFEEVVPEPEPARILFLGSLDWRPNLDAVDVLLDRIRPLVQAVIPETTFAIVGRRPSDALARRISKLPGVELYGDVEDVRPHLAKSLAMVVPLRVGGGSRLKILEALACRVPVVSTRVGAEGLELAPGRHYIQADSPEETANALIDLIHRPEPAQTAAEEARRFVFDRYDWDELARRLDGIWREVAQSSGVDRPVGVGS